MSVPVKSLPKQNIFTKLWLTPCSGKTKQPGQRDLTVQSQTCEPVKVWAGTSRETSVLNLFVYQMFTHRGVLTWISWYGLEISLEVTILKDGNLQWCWFWMVQISQRRLQNRLRGERYLLCRGAWRDGARARCRQQMMTWMSQIL